jgi:hypothetical protein
MLALAPVAVLFIFCPLAVALLATFEPRWPGADEPTPGADKPPAEIPAINCLPH